MLSQERKRKSLPVKKLTIINEHQFNYCAKLGLIYSKKYKMAEIPNNYRIERRLRRLQFFDNLRNLSVLASKEKKVHLQGLNYALKRALKLKSLSLEFEKCDAINGKRFGGFLLSVFKKVLFLEKLGVDLAWCNWTKDFPVLKSKKTFLFLKYLKNFSFNLSGYSSDRVNECLNFIKYILQRNIKNLKSTHLNLSR